MDPGFEGAEPNFRQVGTRTTGRLLVGTTGTHAATTKKAGPASIPSKFETILYTGDNEVDGFASRVSRFKSQPNDLPGAGSYHQESSMVFNHDSISKKGYGNGFVSKTNRFFYVDKAGAPAYFPGPGAYSSTDFLTQKNQANYNRAETSAVFRSQQSAPLIPPNREVPGPGEYHHDALQRKRRSRRERVPEGHSKHRNHGDRYGPNENGTVNHTLEAESNQSFGSVEKRFKEPSNDSPAPGHYNPDGPPGAMWAPNDYPSAAFKSGSERNTMDANTENAEYPGPAHYRPRENEERDRAEEAHGAHKNFKSGQIDRFGKPLVRRKPLDNYPGPGTYDDPPSFGKSPYMQQSDGGPPRPHTRPKMSGSAAGGYTYATRKRYGGMVPIQTTASISASLQHDIIADKNIRPPGPAYYKPDKIANIKQRSYHLNMQQKWV